MATEIPDVALVTDGQEFSKRWAPGEGLTFSRTWQGTRAKVDAKFQELQTEGETGGNIAELLYRRVNGRVSLTANYGRDDGNVTALYGEEVTMIEELYGVDVIRDLRAAPYFTSGTYNLTDDQAAVVMDAVDNNYKETEISDWGSWTDGQKQLRYHMLHGQDSYIETGFIMRQSVYGVRNSSIQAAFTDINEVVTAPTFKTSMSALLATLPSGEWLKKPPQAQYLGRGNWRIVIEYHYAEKWSKMYGGTWGL